MTQHNDQKDTLNALVQAAFYGDAEMVNHLLDNGANIDAEVQNSWNPLHAAIENEQCECVDILIRRGADIEKMNAGLSPLAHAIDISIDGTIQSGGKLGDEPIDIILLLLNAGANPESGLDIARVYTSKKILRLLMTASRAT